MADELFSGIFSVMVRKILAIVGSFVAVLSFLSWEMGLRINLSASMPLGVYKIAPVVSAVRRGDIIAVCTPYSTAVLGRVRGYITAGTCPGNAVPLLKVVAAVGGDVLSVNCSGISVNGSLLPESRSLGADAEGRELSAWKVKHYVMPAKMLWVYAPSLHSWDSRYWGPVSVGQVIGLASPVLLVSKSFKIPYELFSFCRSCSHR